jgi:hypothetical protein
MSDNIAYVMIALIAGLTLCFCAWVSKDKK